MLLDSVVSKVSSAHSTGREVVPWLWSEYGLPGGCGGGLKMSNFTSLVYSLVEKCFVMEIKRTENSRLNRRETGNKSYSIVKHFFTFFLGAGEGGTDFLASLTWESDELRELAAAGEM